MEIVENRWGVILAGGDGLRLRPLTRLLTGDDRPKQFCSLTGGETLLDQSRTRAARSIPVHQTAVVVTQAHREFYSTVRGVRLIEQPVNRGTAAAILLSLLRVGGSSPDPLVAMLPSDHHYKDESRFTAGLDSAFHAARSGGVVLLGAAPSYPEPAYGWIEPVRRRKRMAVLTVRRFWEKPSLEIARRLLSMGCLWNTFVMAGRRSAFLRLIERRAPELFRAASTATAYHEWPAVDFSSRILATEAASLRVLPMEGAGWSDLGEPQRAMAALGSAVQGAPSVGVLSSSIGRPSHSRDLHGGS